MSKYAYKPLSRAQIPFLIGFALFAAGLVWLSMPAATDTQRIAFACALPLAAGWMIWKKRKSFWWPPFILVLLVCALIAVEATGPPSPNWFFELFVTQIFSYALATFLCWILVGGILPRTTTKYQALPILSLSLVFPIGMLGAGFSWWFTAVEINVYPQLPVVRSAPQFAKEYEAKILGYRGLLLVGRVGDLQKAETPPETRSDLVAYYETRLGRYSYGSRDLNYWYPQYYTVTLEDGTVVKAQGNTSRLKTYGWPEVPNLFSYSGLRHGDPVVIWGDPVPTTRFGTWEKSWSLANTRMVAYGTPEEFIENFILPGVRTARAYGWVGFGCMFLSIVPMAIGVRRYFWLKKHGSDEPPPPEPGSLEALELQKVEKAAAKKAARKSPRKKKLPDDESPPASELP